MGKHSSDLEVDEVDAAENGRPRRLRRYLFAFVGFAIAAGLGIASAQWVSIPKGHGHAYGKGQNATQGIAIGTVDYTSGDPAITAIGPAQTGSVLVGLTNANAFPVNITAVDLTPGGQIVSVADPTCVANAPQDFTLTSWAGSLSIAAGSPANPAVGRTTMALTTTDTFPSCLAGQVFAVDIDVSAVAA